MLDYLVAASILAMWVVFIGAPVILGGLRVVAVVTQRYPWPQALAVIFLPFSCGFFWLNKEKSRLKKIYEVMLGIFVFLSVYGAIFMLYTHFG